MSKAIRLAITMGDPAGIGPEIIVKAAQLMREETSTKRMELLVLGSAAALDRAGSLLGVSVKDLPLRMIDVGPVAGDIKVGEISAVGGEWAYQAVKRATEMVQAGEADAIVTAPLSKEALHMAGHHFEGHTELLAHLTGQRDAVMMLAHGPMRVSHVTTHCAIADVPARLTPTRLRRVIDVTLNALECLGIEKPRLAIAGLNPHAGEGGILGKEENEIITPVINEYVAQGHQVIGPVPGDTVFIKLRAEQFDAVVAMFHDQGHIPVKLLGFNVDPVTGKWQAISGVNITLGLPILRTSVDHGTAFDIAGKGIANADSLVDAALYAMKLLAGQKRQAEQKALA
ncbi:4-hydroxythreonine-4-phosphate dehydrogenase PdxA [Uliginosibacterium gangwonense]|uniref:4-hydroxythreonine-4-phosphate dehydrogenase PdxA n=1 Tax=Uliginosibacterium gangwonense TaxID=392736 RepID=UPI000375749B|nr:4-hydroxythreonine-4-phosphate dehydrogenase PdxA [Uliginosibacterium gangwonense]